MFVKKHKILIYFSKTQCKWKLLNFLGFSDSFNELLVGLYMLVGLDINTNVRRGGRCAMALPSDPKNKKIYKQYAYF